MTALLVLAAGLGRRLANADSDLPKALLPLPSGRPLLAETLTGALATGAVARAVVVTGYQAELIDREVARHECAASIATVHNPDYRTSGPVRSLWTALDLIEATDAVIVNGDTLYRPEAIHAVARRRRPGFHLAYSRRAVEHDDVKLVLSGGRIASVGKQVDPAAADGVSAGLFLVRGTRARARFASILESFVRDQQPGGQRAIWHDVVQALIIARDPVFAVEVDHGAWREVDTPEDYAALLAALT